MDGGHQTRIYDDFEYDTKLHLNDSMMSFEGCHLKGAQASYSSPT
jgi:hypothetical protein